MTRSFATPENQVNRCPICNTGIQIEPTTVFGDFDCADCGKTLWYLAASNSVRFFDHSQASELRDYVIGFIAERLEVDRHELAADPHLLDSSDTDSLERLEMLMELEEELEIA